MSANGQKKAHLFVYGTLRLDHPMHRALARHGEFVGTGGQV